MSVSKQILFVTWHQFLTRFFPSCMSRPRTTGFESLGKYLSSLPIPCQYFMTIWKLQVKCQYIVGFSSWEGAVFFLYLRCLFLFINRIYLSPTDFRILRKWFSTKIDALNPWILKYFTGAIGLLHSFCHLQNCQNRKLHEIILFIFNLPVYGFICLGDKIFFLDVLGLLQSLLISSYWGKSTINMI